MDQGYEIDFLAVGDGSKGGDAIALRFGNLRGGRNEQFIMTIDGGGKESGKRLVEHIKRYYSTDYLDAVLATHPDADHVSGLSEVLENLSVGELWMHRPWDRIVNIKTELLKPYTNDGVTNYVKASIGQAFDLEKIAIAKGVKICEPFAGAKTNNGAVQILGPSEDYYSELLPQFRSTPDSLLGKISDMFGHAYDFASENINKVIETLEIETLKDGGEHFSAENNSSVIMLLVVGDRKILFTGDADADALTRAVDFCEQTLGIGLNDLYLLQVPHHGSKHNVGPTILNRIKPKNAQISAPSNSNKHPHQSVINALIRRDASVTATMGKNVLHHFNSDSREGWVAAVHLPFQGEFDD